MGRRFNIKNFKDVFLYLIIGGVATIAEWIIFYLINGVCSWHYIYATVIAYIFSTFVNWLSGRLILFKESKKSIAFELISIYAASVIGLLLNMVIMWMAVEICHLQEMLSKIIATGLVFVWNYLIRKMFIYKE